MNSFNSWNLSFLLLQAWLYFSTSPGFRPIPLFIFLCMLLYSALLSCIGISDWLMARIFAACSSVIVFALEGQRVTSNYWTSNVLVHNRFEIRWYITEASLYFRIHVYHTSLTIPRHVSIRGARTIRPSWDTAQRGLACNRWKWMKGEFRSIGSSPLNSTTCLKCWVFTCLNTGGASILRIHM